MKLHVPLLALCLLLPSLANAKPFWRSKNWWIAEAGSAALAGVDAWSTHRALERCPGCGDNFPFFMVNKSGSLAAAAMIGLGISTGFHVAEYHFANKSTNLATRTVGTYMQLGIDSAEHGWAINNNLRIQCTRAALNCN